MPAGLPRGSAERETRRLAADLALLTERLAWRWVDGCVYRQSIARLSQPFWTVTPYPVAMGHSRRVAAIALAGATATGIALSGCGVVGAAKKVENTVHNNTAVVDEFTTSLKSGQPASFAVAYTTTGGVPSKIVYAVGRQPISPLPPSRPRPRCRALP